jgi:CoA:oxalate CoA-transferase
VQRSGGAAIHTTRGPLRIDGQRAASTRGAPRVGEHGASVLAEFGLARQQDSMPCVPDASLR